MDNQASGFDCEFVDQPQKSFQSECPVCLLVLREPYQVDCCGYAFCRVCIERIQRESKPCPCCNAETFDKFEDKGRKRSLSGFKVHCSNSEQGCQWVGELGQLDNHLNLNPSQQNQLQGCQLSRVKCLHCSQLFLRSDIEAHQYDQCPRRPFNCQYCKDFDSCYEEVATNHWPVCGSYPMPCANKCDQTVQRQNLDNHIANDCPRTIIDCDFQHVGCRVRLPRKDMPAHQGESVVNHLSFQAAHSKQVELRLKEEIEHSHKTIRTLKEENKELKEQLKKLSLDLSLQNVCSPVCPVEFMITDFEDKIQSNEMWCSPPFYTHVKGYKILVKVFPNGMSHTSQQLSVSIHLMKGEFDKLLTWPFRGTLDVQLINQHDNVDHLSKEAIFQQTSAGTDLPRSREIPASGRARRYSRRLQIDAGKRDVDSNTSATGFCISSFITHTDLRMKYIKNDCLKISVRMRSCP